MALRILRHREDAADAVQDAMHQLFRKQQSYDASLGSIRSWFLKIVRNRCIDMQRKKRPVSGTQDFNPVDDGTATPGDVFQRDELIAMVRSALDRLPESSREIILLRDFHGLSYAEIGDVLGVASGTVMSRLHRARQQLRSKVILEN